MRGRSNGQGRGDRGKPEEAERGERDRGSPRKPGSRKPFSCHLYRVGPQTPPRSISESASVKAELSGRGGRWGRGWRRGTAEEMHDQETGLDER